MSAPMTVVMVLASLFRVVDVASKALAARLQRMREARLLGLSWLETLRCWTMPAIAGASDANRVALLYVKETTWGETPQPAPTLKAFRFTSEDLRSAQQTVNSQELRDDRQVSDVLRTGISAEGGVNFELSYGSQDDLLEGWAMGAWTAPLSITGTLSAANPGNTITAAAGNPDLSAVQVGQWIKLSGFNNPANNGFFKVVDKSAAGDHVLTLAGGTLQTEAGDGDEKIESSGWLTNGVTPISFSLEKQYLDVGLFDSFLGMRISTFELAMAANAIITGAFGFLGKKGAEEQAATIGDGNPTPVNDHPVMNAIDHIVSVMEAGAETTLDITSLTLRGDNNLRTLAAIRSLGAINIGLGSVVVTGTLEAYFANRALLDKFRKFTKTAMAIRLVDTLGNVYVIEIPRIAFSSGQAVTPGINQDVIARFEWSAERDPLSGKTISINRFAIP